ncbi:MULTISPECIES: SLBB domain-containing protein [unclassified Lentimonas]|uniref:SLBB domain-containing protein n=1 Tax=unclassified Lentimonas TaxID=2630993 RepID=UPI00132B5B6F|nr:MULTISPECIES: SLBB domain-containing protein [unclassified Lentimonas]CAA6690756.1 Unannotated [Lentimonas sp. CC19]CAA6693317.1 Unannotated [Lentimonas sp. CC10]CAA7071797.1 Unannotated [Lentimonas sp. CC11]
MKTLHFNISRITISLLSVLLCSILHANESDSYDWAYQLREEVQQVPDYTDSNAHKTIQSDVAPTLSQEAWPWGTPKNLLNPVEEVSSRAKPSTRRTNNRLRTNRGSSNSAPSPSSITVNINNDGEEQVPESIALADSRSRLEELYSGDFSREASRELEQFGYDVFEPDAVDAFSTGPTPASYIIGAGDTILVTLSGTVDAFHQLTVDQDGLLSIPEFGTVQVAGISYGTLNQHLLSFLQQRRHGFELTVSIGNRRAIQVNIVGRVANPGRIQVPALSNLLVALSAAGGVNKDGTLRNIVLTRPSSQGDTQIVIDLYDYLRNPGNEKHFPQLQEQDTLYVPAIGSTVGIAGYVQAPGIYEIKQSSFSIGDALQIAGGLTPFSFTPLAQIERTIDGRGRKRCDIELNETGLAAQMLNGELLMIEAVDDQRQSIVRIEGEVARPGDYEYTPGMTISELIERADGLTVDAYIKQAFISRQVGEHSAIEEVPGRSVHHQSKRVLVAQLDKALMRAPEHDLQLMPLDLITIRSRDTAMTQPVVEIIGSVQRPGKYELTASMRVSDLIAIAGNLTPEVYYDEAELIRRHFDAHELKLDVKRYRFNLQEALHPAHHYDNTFNPVLSNGDQLVIRSLQKAQVRVKIGGRVRFPGEYIFPDGAQITDLIKAAGGILDDADLRASVFSRESTRRLQQSRLDNLVERTRRLAETSLQRMVQTGQSKEGLAAKIALEQTEDMLARLDAKSTNGRIVIPFNEPDFPASPYNLPLQTGDTLLIPRSHPTVSVSGDVFRPVTFIVVDGITVQDALEKAGGLTEMADEDLIYVIRANGEIERSKKSRGFIKKKTVLYAGDVLLAPTQPMKRTLGAQFSDIMMLTRQLAEIAVITTNGNKDFDVSLVSPFTPNTPGVDAAILLED